MPTQNPFPLQILEKIDDPLIAALLAQFGHDKYVNAADINELVQALKYLYENLNGEGSGDFLTYDQYVEDIISRLELYQPILNTQNFGDFIVTLGIKNTLQDNDEVVSKNSVTGKSVRTTWLNVWANYLAIKVEAKITSMLNTFSTAHFLDFTSSGQTQLNSKIPLSQKAAPLGVATLDSEGKIPNNQLPALAITDTFVRNSQAAMLLTSSAETGDVCVRTDINKTFILTASPPSTLSNWQEMLTPTDSVTSVDGQVGAVNLGGLYEPKSSGTTGNIPRYKPGGGTENTTNKSVDGDVATPSYIQLDGTYRVGGLLWDKLKFYLLKLPSESYGFGLGDQSDVQYQAGGISSGMHRFYTSRIERFRIWVNGNVSIFNIANSENRLLKADVDGVIGISSISETSTTIENLKRSVSTTGTNGGFENKSYTANSHNNIWRIGSSPEYGMGYYQGLGDSGSDFIGLHFGDRNFPGIKFMQNGRIEIQPAYSANHAIRKDQVESMINTLMAIMDNEFVTRETNQEINSVKEFLISPLIPNGSEDFHPATMQQLYEVVATESFGINTEWEDIPHTLPSSFNDVILRYKIKNSNYILDFSCSCDGSNVVGSVTDLAIATLPGVDSEKLKTILLDSVFSKDNGDGISKMMLVSNGEPDSEVRLHFTFRDVIAFEDQCRATLPIVYYNS